ncbi:MAG: hypothetical protein OEM00_12980 [Burkholderiaceae bacterium]|nr:hypothetical protein [Burkholderiaceae bacterium]
MRPFAAIEAPAACTSAPRIHVPLADKQAGAPWRILRHRVRGVQHGQVAGGGASERASRCAVSSSQRARPAVNDRRRHAQGRPRRHRGHRDPPAASGCCR